MKNVLIITLCLVLSGCATGDQRFSNAFMAMGQGFQGASRSNNSYQPPRNNSPYCVGIAPLAMPSCRSVCISGKWEQACN